MTYVTTKITSYVMVMVVNVVMVVRGECGGGFVSVV